LSSAPICFLWMLVIKSGKSSGHPACRPSKRRDS